MKNEIISNYADYEGKKVVVSGRIMALRKMGKASFAQLMDAKGRIQIFIRRDDIGDESYSNFKLELIEILKMNIKKNRIIKFV